MGPKKYNLACLIWFLKSRTQSKMLTRSIISDWFNSLFKWDRSIQKFSTAFNYNVALWILYTRPQKEENWPPLPCYWQLPKAQISSSSSDLATWELLSILLYVRPSAFLTFMFLIFINFQLAVNSCCDFRTVLNCLWDISICCCDFSLLWFFATIF